MTDVDKPSTLIESDKVKSLRLSLGTPEHTISEAVESLTTILPEFGDEQEATQFLRSSMGSYGISELMNSRNARIEEENGNYTLKYPVSDLYLDEHDNFRITGECLEFQRAMCAAFFAVTPDIPYPQTNLFRQWISFDSVRKGPDYYHYFMGKIKQGNFSGMQPSVLHTLDPSKFFTRIFSMRGSKERRFRESHTETGTKVMGEHNLSNRMIPYYESETETGAYLISVGLVNENDQRKARITYEVIEQENTYAPDRTIDFEFDIDNPDSPITGMLSKYKEFISYTEGCKYESENNISYDDISEDDKNAIEKAKNQFINQVKQLINK
jgi:hypothetical protein